MGDVNDFSRLLFGFGISVGALAGVVVSFVSRVELGLLLSFGVAGGILVASLITLVIRYSGFGGSFLEFVLVGLGSGFFVGTCFGLLVAWTVDGSYFSGSLIGGGVGLLAGALLVLVASYFEDLESK